MTEIHYRARAGNISIKITGENQKVAFQELAQAQDVFDAESQCGLCGSREIRFAYRNVSGNGFYELMCQNPPCGARFQFGQHRTAPTLFPKREGPHGGWAKYVPRQEQENPA